MVTNKINKVSAKGILSQGVGFQLGSSVCIVSDLVLIAVSIHIGAVYIYKNCSAVIG